MLFKRRNSLRKSMVLRRNYNNNSMVNPIYEHDFYGEYMDSHCHMEKILKKCNITLNGYRDFSDANFRGNYKGSIIISCSKDFFNDVIELVGNNHDLYGSFGIHPNNANEWNNDIKDSIVNVKEQLNGKMVAVGECGLDYYRNTCDKMVQQQVFVEQIKLSQDLNLPLVVHTRQAEQDTIEIMKKYCNKNQKIHVHCFTDSSDMAQVLCEYFPNLMIGFTGIITFNKNNNQSNLANILDLDRILLETDGPFLSPKPYRGKCSHPGYIPIIAQCIANIKNIDIESVLKRTYNNCTYMYNI